MDNNPVTPQPEVTTLPTPSPASPTTASVPSSRPSLLLILLGVLLIGLAVVGGIYFYTQKMNLEQPPETSKVDSLETSLESELNEVTLEDGDEDFIQIDQDISSL